MQSKFIELEVAETQKTGVSNLDSEGRPQLLKKCPSCSKLAGRPIAYPATTAYFYRDKTKKDKLACQCRKCHRRHAKNNYHKKHPESKVNQARNMSEVPESVSADNPILADMASQTAKDISSKLLDFGITIG